MRKRCSFLLTCLVTMAISGQLASAAIHYVDKGNAGTEPYATQGTAAGDIQTAIDYASEGATVMVYAATYDLGGMVSGYGTGEGLEALTNRVVINKAISVRSVNNDPANTIIKGAWNPTSTNGPGAIRCVYMRRGSELIGFTITNGATLKDVVPHTDLLAGGIFCDGGSPLPVVSNCVVAGNAAYGSGPQGIGGGGVYRGNLYQCKILGNQVGPGRVIGGGAFGATLYNCLLAHNVAEQGAGAFRGELHDCVVSNNTSIKMTSAWAEGGGIRGWSAASPCHMYGGTLIGNTADRGGGASSYTFLSNVTVKLNSVPVTPGQSGYGGGAYQATMVDCTLVSNIAANLGSGGYQGYYTNCTFAYHSMAVHGPLRIVNCLFYGNGTAAYMALAGDNNYIDSCTFAGNNNGIYDYYSPGTIRILNCISYSNTANWVWKSATMIFSNTCTTPAQDGWDASNTTEGPRFVSFGSGFGTGHVPGDYHLTMSSPCLNTGLNQGWMIDALDLDGEPRLDSAYGAVDMGCYELPLFAGTTIIVK